MADSDDYNGKHSHDPMGRLLEAAHLVNSESMDMTNDPRFFSDNVINYRLAAFAGLSVVSGLMIQNAMDHIFGMDKRMSWGTLDGFCQTIAFFILLVILFLSTIATYVGVAQPYHTVRLMTAGATGFEAAASYYLNRSIVVYRHLAVKAMLISLPLFMIQAGLRLVMKFDRENGHDDAQNLSDGECRIFGAVACIILLVMGFFIIYIHWQHSAVFRERYSTMTTHPSLNAHMQSIMMPRAMASMMGGGRRGRNFAPDV